MNIDGFLNKNPFVRIVLPFAIGIVLHHQTEISTVLNVAILCVSTILSVLFYNISLSYKYRWLPGAMLFVNLCALGYTTASLNNSSSFIPPEANTRECTYRACITNNPSHGEKACKVDLRVEAVSILGKWYDFDAKIVATIMNDSLTSQLKAGNTIQFSSKIDSIDLPKNPFGFNYSQYLQLNGVQGSIFLNSGEWHISDEGTHGLKQHALNIRMMLIGLLEKAGLEGNELGLASTLVLGYKNSIDDDVKQAYMNAGAMHVLAVSGMHVGIVCIVLELLMKLFGGNRFFKTKRVIIIALLWAYAFITGLSPSVLRATVMFTAVELARLLNKEMTIYNTLAISAVFLLTIRPEMLFHAGFQLSYAAVVGIVYFQPRIVKLIKISKKRRLLRYIWELTAVSIAAQISTLPFCLFYFERTPVYFWLSNIVVSPGAVVMISLTLLLLAVSPFDIAAKIVGTITSYTAKLMNYLVTSISNLPFSTIENTYITLFQAAMVAVIIISATIWLNTREYNWLLGALTAFLAVIIPSSIESVRNSSAQALCVYYSPKNAMAHFVDGNSSYWIRGAVGDKKQAGLLTKGGNIHWRSVLTDYYDYTAEIRNGHLLTKNGFFVFDSISGLTVNDSTMPFKIKSPQSLDYLIVSGKPNIRAKDLPKTLHFKKIIIDASVPAWIAKDWERKFSGSQIHNVRRQGAYIHQMSRQTGY
ncbi:MAG: ComEC family competence protein [Salinivirgaceae bacterium]|nr:ComEC family competence protein [Salinivirgaceae bacterium]